MSLCFVTLSSLTSPQSKNAIIGYWGGIYDYPNYPHVIDSIDIGTIEIYCLFRKDGYFIDNRGDQYGFNIYTGNWEATDSLLIMYKKTSRSDDPKYYGISDEVEFTDTIPYRIVDKKLWFKAPYSTKYYPLERITKEKFDEKYFD